MLQYDIYLKRFTRNFQDGFVENPSNCVLNPSTCNYEADLRNVLGILVGSGVTLKRGRRGGGIGN